MKDYWCPLIRKNCIGSKCAWHTSIAGQNPNTGMQVNEPGCVVAFLPMLLIENSQQQRSTGSAVESFRNEMTKAHRNAEQLLIAASNMVVKPQITEG
jgi:hypothetical protein